MSAAPSSLSVPASPSSSKRSRSRDSSRSAATTSTIHTPHFLTPSASAPSLIIPEGAGNGSGNVQGGAAGAIEPQDPTPYPAFLRYSKAEIHSKFEDLEWQQRKRLLPNLPNDPERSEQSLQWARCVSEEVMGRNRYANVDPYANNRVKLQVPEGQGDYINASPIVLESTKSKTITKFIATQGPKSDSFAHIWRMIWHSTASPAVIIMLTKTFESGREKCFQYYPSSPSSPTLKLNESDEFQDGFTHDLKLVSLTNNEEVRAEVRELDMATEDGSESKTIWHLLFSGWPDFLVPEGDDRDALLKLIDLSREKNKDNANNPRIVHCSAGVGRSGSFIALDWLLQELEEGSLDDLPDSQDPVYQIVDNLRKQRMMMVQGEAQLNFLYEVIRDRWRDRWIQLHPEEAEKLGLTSNGEPTPKKVKTSVASDVSSQGGDDEDERAQLEAELMDAGDRF